MIKALIVTALLTSLSAMAQTVTPGPTNQPGSLSTNVVVNLINQGIDWLTDPDTNNLTLSNTKFRIESGPAIQSGLTISDDVFLQYNIAYSNRLALCSETRNASIAGTIVSEEVGIGYNVYQKYDTEITAFALGGYRFDTSHPLGSFGAKVRHMLNKTMYVAPGVQIDFQRKTLPMATTEVGFAF